jgi:UDP-N-acetylmuramoyl-tripeptide--D-alanyl-D-alanine ligase
VGIPELSAIIRRSRARLNRYRSRATFVGITGSSGKTTTTAMLSHILAGQAPVASQVVDNQIGSQVRAMNAVSASHRHVICELGTDGPGTLQPMIDLVQPSVGVVTLVALEHFSAFRTLDAVAEEKQKLVEALPESGLAVLNRDDPRVLAMASRTQARVVTFGTSDGDYRITQLRASMPGQLAVTIAHQGETFEVQTQLTGAHQSLAVAAAFACAHQLGVPASLIATRLASCQAMFGRCSVHVIESGPVFIVDTVKAPYCSIYLPINMMAEFNAPRKRIVIGQISDAGNTNPKYRDVYRASRSVADQVIFVGDNAHRSKATPEEIEAGRFVEKRNVKEAAEFVKDTAIPGEIILLKSSSYLHLERVFLNFERQVRCWEQSCGRVKDCLRCGSYAVPFERGKKRKGRTKWKRYAAATASDPGRRLA